MQADFWLSKWQRNEIGFHKAEANPFLVKHLSALELSEQPRVFVPLCGKTLDIGWLLAQGIAVAGIELSIVAVEQLFAELGVEPEITEHGRLTQFKADGLDVFVGDIFELYSELLGKVDAVYDRAAFIALPESMRAQYSSHLQTLTANAQQLLVTMNYDTSQMTGPPFSIAAEEVVLRYEPTYQLNVLQQSSNAHGLKGKYPLAETVWHLTPR